MEALETQGGRIDHMVLAARTLAEGVAFLRGRIGTEPSPGGAHPTMGTHNAVLKLGERLYLEIIAVDPAAAAPERPRWMALDDPAMQNLLEESPRLVCWMATTRDIAGMAARFGDTIGTVWNGERGRLRWQLSVRPDGALPAGGALPSLIQWPEGVHPADNMPDLGFRFRSLTVRHRASAWVEGMLDKLETRGCVNVVQAEGGEPTLALILEKDGREIAI